jgi:CRP-like cAMP-binding protein
LRACTLAYLSGHDFTRFADDNPIVYRHMLEILSARLRASSDALAAHQLLPLSGRLARALLRLAEGFGQTLDDDRVLIRHKFTQSDLAKMTGSARENVNRQLNGWKKQNILSRVSSYYCIDDTAALRDLAKF